MADWTAIIAASSLGLNAFQAWLGYLTNDSNRKEAQAMRKEDVDRENQIRDAETARDEKHRLDALQNAKTELQKARLDDLLLSIDDFISAVSEFNYVVQTEHLRGRPHGPDDVPVLGEQLHPYSVTTLTCSNKCFRLVAQIGNADLSDKMITLRRMENEITTEIVNAFWQGDRDRLAEATGRIVELEPLSDHMTLIATQLQRSL